MFVSLPLVAAAFLPTLFTSSSPILLHELVVSLYICVCVCMCSIFSSFWPFRHSKGVAFGADRKPARLATCSEQAAQSVAEGLCSQSNLCDCYRACVLGVCCCFPPRVFPPFPHHEAQTGVACNRAIRPQDSRTLTGCGR